MNQNLWDAEKAVLSGKFIAVQSYLKTRNISSKQPNLTPKAIRERRTKPPPKLTEGKES